MDNVKTSEISPSLGLPLVDTKMGLGQIVLDPSSSDMLNVDDDSLIHIIFQQSLTSISMSDIIVEIPDVAFSQDNTIDPIEIDGFTNSSSVELSEVVSGMDDDTQTLLNAAEDNGTEATYPAFSQNLNSSNTLDEIEDFDQVVFSDGTMTLTVTNNWPFEIQNLVIEILNEDNSALVSYTFVSIPAGNTASQDKDLTGKTMDNQLTTRVGTIESPGSGGDVPVDLSQTLAIDFTAENLTVASGTVVIPSMDVVNDTINNAITMENGEQLHSFVLGDGSLDLDITYELQENCNLTLTIPNASKNNVIFSQTINMDPLVSAVYNESYDLTGYTFNFADADSPNTIQAIVAATIVSSGAPVVFSTDQAVDVSMTLGNFEISYIQGYLGNIEQSFASDPIDFDLGTDVLPGDVQLAAPSLSMRFVNSFGLPFALNLNGMYAIDEDGNQINFTGSVVDNPAVIDAPGLDEVGDSITSVVSLNNETSNITAILNAKPSQIVPAISVSTNPAGATDSNFVDTTSTLNAYIDVDIPLYASIANFGLRDTLDNSIQLGSSGIVDEANIIGQFENDFPIEMIIQLYFCNEDQNGDLIIIDSLITGSNAVAAAELDDNGNVLSSGVSELSVLANSKKLADIAEATKMLLDLKVQSPENGTKAGKFYTTSEMRIKIGLIATINPLGGGGSSDENGND
jgi:hypothetical protein